MNYEEMSDNEINLSIHLYFYQLSDGSLIYDYCNNPSDAWPIIVENKISTFYTGEGVYGWAASSDVFEFYSKGKQIHQFDKNPLRAAMIVFLKMQE